MAKLTAAGALTSTDDSLIMGTANAAQVGVNVTGTWTGTITFEVRRGQTWENAPVFTVAGVGASATTTANVSRRIDTGGTNAVRARFSTPTSGSPYIQFDGTEAGMGGSGSGGGGGGASTIADGADVAEGTTTDSGVITDTSGTVIGFLRGAIKMWITFLSRLPAALVSGRLDVNLGAAPATVTVDSELPTAAALSDATANPTAPMVGSATMGWDGTNWARNNLINGSADARGATASVGLIKHAFHYIFNGTTWDRVRGATADALAATGIQGIGNLIYNGATWDRMQGDAQKQARVVAAGYTTIVTSTLTRPANTTAYAAGDEVTDTGGAIITLTGVARYSGGTGCIQGVAAVFSDNWATKPSAELWIFDTTSTPQTDNAAFAPSDAEAATCIAIIPLSVSYVGDATGSTGNFIMDTGQINVPFLCVGSANLFLRMVVRNAAQAGANSGTIKFRVRCSCD